MECECFCQEGVVNTPCNGERTDCPYFKEVDTLEYDKEIRDEAIDEFAKKCTNYVTTKKTITNIHTYCTKVGLMKSQRNWKENEIGQD